MEFTDTHQDFEKISINENDMKMPEALRGLFLGPSRCELCAQ